MALALALVLGILSLALSPKEEAWLTGNTAFTTAELALKEHWIKGAAPILAANFESVRVERVNKDVSESFVFDVALGQIYKIDADYTLPPLDVRSLKLEKKLEPFQRERSEIFCNNEDLKYCELILAWDDQAPERVTFVALRIDDALYALVEDSLATRLGVSR